MSTILERPSRAWLENEAHPLHLSGISIMEGVNVVAKLEDFSLVQIGSQMVIAYNASAAKDAKIAKLEASLKDILDWPGNLSDESYARQCGPNESVDRGLKIVAMRHFARLALALASA